MRVPRLPQSILLFTLAAVAATAAAQSAADKRSKKEERTQVLQLPVELPAVTTGNPRRLKFYVTPLTGKGLLTHQIREALKALARESGGETVLKIRAFVAGSGDVRRVRDLVSEEFTERRGPLPALTLVRAGGLPLEGAQVVLEAIAEAHKDVNPHGLAFFSAQVADAASPLDPAAPLVRQALAQLGQAIHAAGATPQNVLRVTCFVSTLADKVATRILMDSAYPHAALNYVQTQRSPGAALAACEAVARLGSDPAAPLQFLNPDGLPRESGQASVALVNSDEVVLTGAQVSFGYQAPDTQLAFDRLQKELTQAGISPGRVAFADYYPLSLDIAAQVRQIRAGVFDAAHPPAGTLLLFEGLPSMDAGFAVDAVAVK
ncbi:MAG TPA: RidA family protein [Bryobacteraceae bacterium]|jgi:enamine deaminase RidA (YjgF/YER057c/UK114 family)